MRATAAAAPPRILADPAAPGDRVRPLVRTAAPVIALRHVRLINGTRRAALADRTILIRQAASPRSAADAADAARRDDD